MIIVTYATPNVAVRTTAEPYVSTMVEMGDEYVDASLVTELRTAALLAQVVGDQVSPTTWVEGVSADGVVATGYPVPGGYELEFVEDLASIYAPSRFIRVPSTAEPNPVWEPFERAEVSARAETLFGYGATTVRPTRTVLAEQIPQDFWTLHKSTRETI